MLEIALSRESIWLDMDWQALATRAATAAFQRSAHAGLLAGDSTIEISLRLTDDDEVRGLNARYRGKDKPTNVLSFPMVEPDLLDTVAAAAASEVLLGDIVLAHGVCVHEATEKGIGVEDHAMHLIVHGTLHLLGYDHSEDGEAEAMERLETDALASLGIADPYLIRED